MSTRKYIPVQEFCSIYQIDYAFIDSLNEIGLVQITTVKETPVIEESGIADLEKMVRLHTELQINLEGIDAISHLLKKVTNLQEEVNMLRNRLNRFEDY